MRDALIAILVVSLAALPAAAEANTVDVPITKVVLFSSGVGYFEHSGEITGDATTELMFKAGQINDVLKSMIVMDLSGKGTVRSIEYASRDPLMRALKSFAVDLSEDPDLGELMHQLRGAEVAVLAPEKITGKVLGVEKREKKVVADGTTTLITETVLNLVTNSGIQAVSLETVQSVELADSRLADELNKALAALLATRDTQRKPVHIHFAGQGKRKVRIGYVAETPVWKTTYRLDLSGEKPRIQGWAIVENTSDNDWSKVDLTLVSGRPISFIQDLYTPTYLPRPVVKPERFVSLRPQTYGEGLEEDMEMAAAPEEPYQAAEDEAAYTRKRVVPRRALKPRAAPAAFAEPEGRAAGVTLGWLEPAAQAGKVGELFRFRITEPVDLARRKSAMLPIINSEIAAEKVSIYNARVLPRYPLNGAYLTNDTGAEMLAGPVTVLDEDMYAGDAQIDHFTPKDKRLISYAVDLSVRVDSSGKQAADISGAKIVRGVLEVTRKEVKTQEYLIKNKADEKRVVIIEHPYNPAEKLLTPDKYEDRTEHLYRFRVGVAKDKTEKFAVVTERVYEQRFAILNYDVGMLVWFQKNARLSPTVRDALGRAIAMRQELAELQRKLSKLSEQKRSLALDQDRLRKNLTSAGRDSTLGKRYLSKMAQQEDEFERLDEQIAATREAIEATHKKLADYLGKLSID